MWKKIGSFFGDIDDYVEAEDLLESCEEQPVVQETVARQENYVEQQKIAGQNNLQPEPKEQSIDVQEEIHSQEKVQLQENAKTKETIQSMTVAFDEETLEMIKLQSEKMGQIEHNISRLTESTLQIDHINMELHKENQLLKEGLYDEMTLPYLKEIIEIAEDLSKEVNNSRRKGLDDVADALEEVLQDNIQLVLERHSIFGFQAEENEMFDPLKHRLVHKIETEDSQMNKKIAKCLGYGYIQKRADKEVLLCPCKVDAYIYNKN